ncbi:hypothetical protein [Microbulbifer sp. ARAS458-1]|uniref:hypothetical protein n=1 Tax=Microbulbifer sp. ARAS458-1 TaxID=3140242 RepID=UPI003877D255
MIRTLIFLASFIFSIPVIAAGVIEEVELSPDLAEKLGFEIVVSSEGSSTMVEVEGPKNLNDGCLPARSGNLLLDEVGNEVAVYITELPKITESPKALGYIVRGNALTLGLFIDYSCPKNRALESRRYIVTSIQAWNS